jgi:hypothetical protein
MNTTSSRILRKVSRPRSRIYPGEAHSFGVVNWLNRVRDKRPRTRVMSLIRDAKEFDSLKQKGGFLPASLIPGTRVRGNEVQLANTKRAAELLRRTKRCLSRYKMYPAFWGQTEGSRWRVHWIKTADVHKVGVGILEGGNYDTIRISEADAVSSMLRLAEEGYLNRLRECRCGRWFYARFRHQQFCGEPCQQQYFRKTPEFRAYNRKYMHDRRRMLAKREGRQFTPRRQRV